MCICLLKKVILEELINENYGVFSIGCCYNVEVCFICGYVYKVYV